MTTTGTRTATRTRATVAAGVADAVAVAVFAAAGRRSHDEPLALAGVAGTAWPFLLGLTVSWVALRAHRAPLAPLRTGLPLALGTVAVGMVTRAVSGQGTAAPFVVVATGTTVALLVGWRGVAALARRGTRG